MFLKLFGLKFVGFSLPDKRHWRWFWQRRRYGFDERELWNLDFTIIKFALPRLKLFRKNLTGWPDADFPTYRDWEKAIDKMISGFELHLKHGGVPFFWSNPANDQQIKENEDYKKFNEGFDLFVKYFHDLWT